jgi:co-chaperonin GroES (HSP10)
MRRWQEWRPYAKWLFVREDKRRDVSKGGIVLPPSETNAEKVDEGTGVILKIGPEASKAAGVGLEPGQRICFRGFLADAFHEFEEDGGRVFMIRAEDVMAIIDKDVTMGVYS